MVRLALSGSAVVSSVNWAELLSKMSDLGGDPQPLPLAERDRVFKKIDPILFAGGALVRDRLLLPPGGPATR